jgi:hypothetical protein
VLLWDFDGLLAVDRLAVQSIPESVRKVRTSRRIVKQGLECTLINWVQFGGFNRTSATQVRAR